MPMICLEVGPYCLLLLVMLLLAGRFGLCASKDAKCLWCSQFCIWYTALQLTWGWCPPYRAIMLSLLALWWSTCWFLRGYSCLSLWQHNSTVVPICIVLSIWQCRETEDCALDRVAEYECCVIGENELAAKAEEMEHMFVVEDTAAPSGLLDSWNNRYGLQRRCNDRQSIIS